MWSMPSSTDRLVRVERSPVHGRGVFACRHVTAGEVLERSPLLLLPRAESEWSTVGFHVFEWDEETVALVLGATSLVNHHDRPSAEVRFDEETLSADLVAVCDIVTDGEVFISYGTGDDLLGWGIVTSG
jgi:hypothetical protein